MHRIFSFLSFSAINRCRLVNRAWSRHASDPALYAFGVALVYTQDEAAAAAAAAAAAGRIPEGEAGVFPSWAARLVASRHVLTGLHQLAVSSTLLRLRAVRLGDLEWLCNAAPHLTDLDLSNELIIKGGSDGRPSEAVWPVQLRVLDLSRVCDEAGGGSGGLEALTGLECLSLDHCSGIDRLPLGSFRFLRRLRYARDVHDCVWERGGEGREAMGVLPASVAETLHLIVLL